MSVTGRGRALEALAILAIVGSLSAMSVPKYADLKRRDTASRVVADVEVVRSGVYGFYSDSAYFPEESPIGLIPEGLEAYLPAQFSFNRSYGTIEYRNWPIGTADTGVDASNVIGVTVTTRDPRIGATAAALARGTAQFTVGNKYTFLFFGS